MNDGRFNSAITSLCGNIKQLLSSINDPIKYTAHEIRLRVSRPLTLSVGSTTYFVSNTGTLSVKITDNLYLVTNEDIEDTFRAICGYSIHTHMHEIKEGFVTLPDGHRAGISGTAVLEAGKIISIREITSINLRIAREVKNIAANLIKTIFSQGLCGVLLVGEPSSGKTTLLRDMARLLSSGELSTFYKVCIVDERCEIGGVTESNIQNDIGITSDLLSGFPKAEGIICAVRSLSPNMIICDEIGTATEAEAIVSALNAGVHIITSIHARSITELQNRIQAKLLLKTGAFQKIVLLSGANTPCIVSKIINVEDVL